MQHEIQQNLSLQLVERGKLKPRSTNVSSVDFGFTVAKEIESIADYQGHQRVYSRGCWDSKAKLKMIGNGSLNLSGSDSIARLLVGEAG
jgi:hypothetical protein